VCGNGQRLSGKALRRLVSELCLEVSITKQRHDFTDKVGKVGWTLEKIAHYFNNIVPQL